MPVYDISFVGNLLVSKRFGPKDIEGIWLWLNASAIGLADGGKVVSWSDASGNGRDFGQGTADNQPVFKTGIKNGKPVVRFDGSNDYLASDSTLTLTQPCTFFVVASRTGNLTSYSILVTQSTEKLAVGFHATADDYYMYDGSAVAAADGGDSAFHIMSFQMDGASSIMRFDGVETAQAGFGSDDATNLTFDVGATNAAAAPLAGDIGEIIIYEAGLSGAQIDEVEGYLSGKWGVSLS